MADTQPKSKKNKNKEKKRLMNLFRGPKAEHKFYRKLTDEESFGFKFMFGNIVEENPSLKLHQNKSTIATKDCTTKVADSGQRITNDLQFGLNSIIRSIEKKSVIGVVLNNPLALPLEDSVIELCSDNQIPCISVHSLQELNSCLNISSLSAIAFKPNITSKDSVFYKLYESFKKIVDKNLSETESINVKDERVKKIEETNVESEASKETIVGKSNEISVESLSDLLYMKKTQDSYRQSMIKMSKEAKPTKDEFSSQQSLIKFSSICDLHFPSTDDFFFSCDKFTIITDEKHETEPKDNSFAQSLIDSNGKSSYLSPKRKFTNEDNNNSVNFKNPRLERIESSNNKMLNRKQLKKQKKLAKNK